MNKNLYDSLELIPSAIHKLQVYYIHGRKRVGYGG